MIIIYSLEGEEGTIQLSSIFAIICSGLVNNI